MKRISVSIEPEQARRLRQLAGTESRAVAALVREALDEYLARRCGGSGPPVESPRREIPEDEWQSRFAAALARVRAAVPPDSVGEKLESEITVARAEVRRARQRPRLSARG